MVRSNPVIVNNRHAIDKLGKGYAVTHASQGSCPKSCPFLHAGCYAETGRMGMSVTSRLNKSAAGPLEVAEAEAAGIDALPGTKHLRLHVVGDCATNAAARIVSRAAADYVKRSTKRNGRKNVHTYTHAWREVKRTSWRKVSVLASCETIAEAKLANKRGYAAAVVVAKHESPKAYVQDGLKVIPCPQQTLPNVTCESCQLCTRDKWLKSSGAVIAFSAHGAGAKTVQSTLIQLGA